MLFPDPHHITRALVFANGLLDDGPAVQEALRYVPDALVIAADGGARLAASNGLLPDIVVGDMDSLTTDEVDQLRARGVVIQRYPAGKNETDLELALLAAVARQANWIRIIGATGARLDHTLANVSLLMLRELAGGDVRIVSGKQTLWLIGPGTHTLTGAPDDTISLIPWTGNAIGVETEHLRYPLRRETLTPGPARGISNVMQQDTARVTLAAGHLLVVHTLGRA
jgi:thiamine pyrophosphokinase